MWGFIYPRRPAAPSDHKSIQWRVGENRYARWWPAFRPATDSLFSGAGTAAHGGAANGIPNYRIATLPRQEFSVLPDLQSVIVVVYVTHVVGFDWRQVADYIAMVGLTKINLDADLGDTPTVLRLFSAATDSKPQSLSAWDVGFIKKLYLANPMYRHQRIDVAKRMVHDLAR